MKDQTRTLIRLLERSTQEPFAYSTRWGRMDLPETIDRSLVCRVGGFDPEDASLGTARLEAPWGDLPTGTTIVKGRTRRGDWAVVAVTDAA